MLRFLLIYIVRGGFLDGLAGLQACMLTAFFNTFVKQARLWELQRRAIPAPAAAREEMNEAADAPIVRFPHRPVEDLADDPESGWGIARVGVSA